MDSLSTELENTRNETIRSPHFGSTLREVAEKAPELSKEVRAILESIDAQGISNLSTFESEEFSGLQIPFTKVNVNTIFGKVFPTVTQEVNQQVKDDSQRIAYFIFRGFAIPPNGHPFTAWNMVYDRVVTEFPKIANAVKNNKPVPEIDVYSLGSPVGMGGRVSKSFIDKVSVNGFETYGKAYVGLVASVLPQDSETQIIFNGNSLGSTIAHETARNIPERKVSVLLDNPVNVEDRPSAVRYLTGIQQAVAYAAETGVRRIVNKTGQAERREEHEFNANLARILKERGIDSDSDEQKRLKISLILLDEKKLIKGHPLDTTLRTFVRRGFKDPLTITPKDYLKGKKGPKDRLTSYGQQGRVSSFVIDSTHFIPRVRVKRWKQAIEFSKKVN